MYEEFSFEVDTIDEVAWHTLLPSFDDANVYSTWTYAAVRWGEQNTSHVVVRQNSSVVALAQVRIINIPILNAGVAYLSWGPQWRLKGEKVNYEILRFTLHALREIYVYQRKLYLRIVPNISDNILTEIAPVLKEEGYVFNPYFYSYNTLILDVSDPLADIRKKMKQKWRGHLNKSERQDFIVTVDKGEESFQKVIGIFNEMHARKKFTEAIDINMYKSMQAQLPDALKMSVMLAEREGKPLSGLIYTSMGDTGIALFSGTTTDGMGYDGSYLLRWQLVSSLHEEGYRYFDQGGVNKQYNPGSFRFKSGLGGEPVHFIGCYDSWKGFFTRALFFSAGFLRYYLFKSKKLLNMKLHR